MATSSFAARSSGESGMASEMTVNARGTKRLRLVSCILAVGLVVTGTVGAATAGETITAEELESYFYDATDGVMKRSEGQFENTYYVDGNTVTRTRVNDRRAREVLPDNTVYYVQRQLYSDPQNNRGLGPPVVRAIGSPGLDAVEILSISDDYIIAAKSTSTYFVIMRLRRIR